MRVIQVLPTLGHGDGVGNDTLAMRDILSQNGYDTAVYYRYISDGYTPALTHPISELPELLPEDVMIYHFSTGWDMFNEIMQLPCRKIMVYHNITPSEYFTGFDEEGCRLGTYGREQLAGAADKFEYCIADSEYNKQELVEYGYTCPIDVLPIIIPFEDYAKEPDRQTIKKYNDGSHNFIFVGRVVPHKMQQDVIAAFHHYKTYYYPWSRLFLVGSEMPAYKEHLVKYIQRLGVKDVIFPGHLSFSEILAYYKISDVFVSMSDHEGFGIPLIEAMFFDMPVIAYNAAAVGSTMGGAGILLDTKDPATAAGEMHRLMRDPLLRSEIAQAQKKRLEALQYDALSKRFLEYIEGFMRKSTTPQGH